MRKNKKLLIIGAGQYGCVAKEIAESMGCFECIEFVDKNATRAIAVPEELSELRSEYSIGIVAIGNSSIRLQYIEELNRCNFELAKLISPKAYVSQSANIAGGCVIEPNATVQANAELSIGCIVSSGAVIGHNSRLGMGCHIDYNATVESNSIVPTQIKLESGCVFRKN